MTARCRACDQQWPRDPALEVACPSCSADVGQKCRRPSEHATYGGQPHADRDRLAMAKLHNYGPCPGAQPEPEPITDLPMFREELP